MKKLSIIIFYILFLTIFLLDGLGVPGGREISFFVIIISPFILFLTDFILKREVVIPKKIGFFFGLFIFFTAISTLFSVNQGKSFLYLIYYTSLLLIFMYVINHSDELRKYFVPFLFIFAGVFSLYAIILRNIAQHTWLFLIPEHGYQVVYARFGLHNHLGDFLVLPILISLYYFYIKRFRLLYLLSTLFFLPFLLYSYSRSAYTSFFLTGIAMIAYVMITKKKKLFSLNISLPLFLFTVVALFFMVTITENSEVPLVRDIKSTVSEYIPVRERILASDRLQFANHALQSIFQKPFFGVGPGNYVFISNEHTNTLGFSTHTSHNIFLDTFTENGVLAGVSFIIFLLLLIKSFDKKNILFFLFVALFINFQTDYTYRIHSMFLLFIILSGLIIKKPIKDAVRLNPLALTISFVIFVLGQYLLFNVMLSELLQ